MIHVNGLTRSLLATVVFAGALFSTNATAALDVSIEDQLATDDVFDGTWYNDIYSFISNEAGTYEFTMASEDFFPYLELYTSPFTVSGAGGTTGFLNQTDSLATNGFLDFSQSNELNKVFEGGTDGISFSYELAESTPYFLVSTSFDDASTGAYTTTVVGPVASVPEPATYAMFLAGLGLLGFSARRKKS